MVVVAVQPHLIGGSGAWGTCRDGSDDTENTAGTEQNLLAFACTSRVDSRRWVCGVERKRLEDLASSERHKKIPKKKEKKRSF